jgi:lysozyme
MQVTEEGLALIREWEGFRGRAYRDAVGVWTIGFGHTSMAGAPEVSPGMEISKEQAEKILARNVEAFARGVAGAVTVTLSGNEFSALVSFAYNVGLGNFRGSSVLKALNAGDRAAVPRRLQLWVKAGGRTLPGLVKRRAAEAALFLKTDEETVRSPVEIPTAKPAHHSTTVWAALSLALLAGLDQVARLLGYGFLGLAAFALISAGVFWIIRERRRKLTEDGV